LASVVIVSMVVIQICVSAFFHALRPDDRFLDTRPHLGTLIRLVVDRPTGVERRRMVETLARTFPEEAIELVDRPPAGALAPPDRHDPMTDDLDRAAPFGVRLLRSEGPDSPTERLAIGLGSSEWLLVSTPRRPPPPPIGPFLASAVFGVVLTALLGLWAVRAIVRPLRTLAEAARDFDIAAEPKPLADSGPDEVRVALRAFDAMRHRIRTLVEDRTGMLAAMGHDLRTPITRLRLRSEFIGDEDLRDNVLRDLELMTGMVEGALSYLRDDRHEEAPERVDLVTLVQTITDQWNDLGHDVAYDGPDHLAFRVRPTSLGRAVANLVDNGAKYGERVMVRLRATADAGVVIEVEDDGPGIPEEMREAVLRPFVRGDPSRNLNDAPGFGLGLAIARAVVEGHGGRMVLDAAPTRGTLVRIELPAETAKTG
jgi:signal transduction histidine kinase